MIQSHLQKVKSSFVNSFTKLEVTVNKENCAHRRQYFYTSTLFDRITNKRSTWLSFCTSRESREMTTTTGNNSNNDKAMSQDINLHRPYFPIYYNDIYEVPLPPNHRFPMEKYRKVRQLVQKKVSLLHDEKKVVQFDFSISPLASVEDLTTTHASYYIERYLKGRQTEEELRNVGFPWSLEGVDRTLSSVGGTVAAATSICSARRLQIAKCDDETEGTVMKQEFGTLWAGHIAGGTHHAFKERGEGFCIFSDIAVAANVILQRYPDIVKRILILDLDVHQGNGNAVLFKGRKEVFTFSIHCSSNYFSQKEESDLDIELPAGCSDETYLSTLQHWLKRLSKETAQFDFIFYQAGVDVLANDRLGQMSLTHEGVKRRNEMVFNFAMEMTAPLCITMGGGYPKDDWAPTIDAHANVYFQAFQFLSQN